MSTSDPKPPPLAGAPEVDPLTLQLVPGVEMTLAPIPPGRCAIGSRDGHSDEQPRHSVQIVAPEGCATAFYLGTVPVTQAAFAVWTAEAGVAHKNHFEHHPDHPAEDVDFEMALDFCRWLGERCGAQLPAGFEVGLPLESHWEYACRAGTTTDYHTGDGEGALAEAGWYHGNADDSTQPVGQKSANGFGLYDMHGNVDEWCLDEWDAQAYARVADGHTVTWPGLPAQAGGAHRVVRGGAWHGSAWWCRAAFRNLSEPAVRYWSLGFRVGVFPGPSCRTGRGGATRQAASRAGGGARRDAVARQPGSEAAGDVDLSEVRFPSGD